MSPARSLLHPASTRSRSCPRRLLVCMSSGGQARSVTATLARDVLEQEQHQLSSASQDRLFNVGLFLWPAEPYGLVITACKPGVCSCALME
jgi:hypothetical protein